jgi:glycosyltransferase involved in cell wall biosynthesis
MSTYNGQKYLAQQLESLQAQTHSQWTLFVRDDGSNDRTLEILREFSLRDSRIRLHTDAETRLGASQSFGLLLEARQNDAYLFFCDQDDIWHPDKIEKSLVLMLEGENKAGAHTPTAVHSDARLVDAEGRPQASSFKHTAGLVFDEAPFFKLLAQNFVTGCTLLVNRALAKASLPIPREALMHDWWIALIAAAQGQILYLPRATLDYRQHDTNASGGAGSKSVVAKAWKIVSGKKSARDLMRQRIAQMRALKKRLERLDPQGPAFMATESLLESFKLGRVESLLQSWRSGVRAQGAARTLLYYALLFLEAPRSAREGAAGPHSSGNSPK